MANPQPDKFTRISNELYEAIMQTDFSKRQRNILDLVIRMSYGCRKKFAILRPSDFEVVGVYRTHIKKELEYLRSAKVLDIDGEQISINKNYDEWRVSLIKHSDQGRFQEILRRNLDADSVTKTVTQNIEKVTETVTDGVTKTVTLDGEGVTKTVINSYQNSNCAVTKTVTPTPDEPLWDAGFRAPKDSIKEIKDSSSSYIEIQSSSEDTAHETETENPSDYSFQRLYKLYEKHFTEDGKVTEFEVQDFGDMFDDHGGEWLFEAMRECARHKIMNLAYLRAVMQGFVKRGGPYAPPDHKPQENISPISNTDETRQYIDAQEEYRRRVEEQRLARLQAAAAAGT